MSRFIKANTKDDKYFANKPAEDAATNLLSRSNTWYNELDTNGYLDKVRMMWAAYHGAYYSDFEDGHNLIFSGEQGELVNFAVNHLRSIATNMLTMITATRPAMKARASNADHKSLVQAKLANGLLDYYMREKRMEDYLRKAAEYAIVLGSGYIKMEWNATTGKIYDYDEDYEIELDENGQPILDDLGEPIIRLDKNGDPVITEENPLYTGDVEFSNLSPFDVVFDATREDQKHDWILCRSQKNRHDLIAKYPEFEKEILALPATSEIKHNAIDSFSYDKTDNVFIYEFYHQRTEALPEGRYMMFVSPQAILVDGAMPYRHLPVFRIAYGDILGTPFGYTPLFDILPIQDAINALHGTILTNQSAFGVQNIGIPVGGNISIAELSGGLNIIEFDKEAGPPVPLQFTSTPEEVFGYLDRLVKEAEVVSGVNSVTRGDPMNLKSGTALALIQSMSIQNMSGLQQSYVRLIEDVGTSLITMLRDFAEAPRVAAISGLRNTAHMKEFVGDDLSEINRVIVEVANPLSNTTAGRLEMAQELLQMGAITSVEQYSTVMNTGRLDLLTQEQEEETLTIQKENEYLLQGEPVIAMITDNHAQHIRSHKSVLADPELRKDPDLVKRVTAHLQEHLEELRSADADLLNIIGEQPLAPQGGSPANQPAQMPPGDKSLQGVTPNTINPNQPAPPAPGLPNLPTPPAPFQNLPVGPGGTGNQGG